MVRHSLEVIDVCLEARHVLSEVYDFFSEAGHVVDALGVWGGVDGGGRCVCLGEAGNGVECRCGVWSVGLRIISIYFEMRFQGFDTYREHCRVLVLQYCEDICAAGRKMVRKCASNGITGEVRCTLIFSQETEGRRRRSSSSGRSTSRSSQHTRDAEHTIINLTSQDGSWCLSRAPDGSML